MAETSTQPRKRINASQTAKGLFQLEATVETFDGSDPGAELLRILKDAEARFLADGKKLVGTE
jgi:hypothetical protein